MKKIMKFIKRNYILWMMVVQIVIMRASTAYAADLESTKLVEGTKSLLTTATTIITGFILALTIFFAIKDIIVWQQANEQEAAGCKKKLIRDISLGVMGVCIGGVITAILAFYQ